MSTFEEWMQEVDQMAVINYGISVHDLPRLNFYGAWEENEAPAKFYTEQVVPLIQEEHQGFYF